MPGASYSAITRQVSEHNSRMYFMRKGFWAISAIRVWNSPERRMIARLSLRARASDSSAMFLRKRAN